MSHLTLVHLERAVAALDPNKPEQSVYVETGRFKPYTLSTVRAAARRGMSIKSLGGGIFEARAKVQA